MQEAKSFKNGLNQAVRLPREYRFEGESVAIRRLGDAVVLQPKKSWDTLFDSLEQFSSDLMEAREQPSIQERDGL